MNPAEEKRALRDDLREVREQLDAQIDTVRMMAKDMGTKPEWVRDSSGSLMLSSLIVAKAQVLCAQSELL